MEDNFNTNSQPIQPAQPLAQPTGQTPSDFAPPVQPTQFVSQPENGGISPKKSKKKLILAVCLIAAVVIAAVVVVLLFVLKKDEPVDESGEKTETSSKDTKIMKDGKWSCYILSTLSGIQADEDGKLYKTGNIESKDNIVFGADGSELEIDLDSKVANDDTYGDKFSIDKKGKDLFYNAQGNTTFDKYKAYKHEDDLDDEEALPSELQVQLNYTIWLNADNQSEMLFKAEAGRGSGYYYMTLYCLNDPELVAEESQPVGQPTDTVLKDYIAQIASDITNYQSNNSGKVPSGEERWNVFLKQYIDDIDDYDLKECGYYAEDNSSIDCADPSDLNWKSDGNEIYVAFGASCNSGGDGIVLGNGPRDYAIYSVLSDNSLYCFDNS